jgi:hypothetical protein
LWHSNHEASKQIDLVALRNFRCAVEAQKGKKTICETSFIEDEGRPFKTVLQEKVSNELVLLLPKATVMSN